MRPCSHALLKLVPLGVCAAAVIAIGARTLEAGGLIRGAAVGGVHVDAQGVVSTPEVGDNEQLLAAWQSGLDPVPADLQEYTDLRYVSLKNLEKQIAEHVANDEPLPDAVRYMAGLLRVKYVFVYPERGDVVLAGPAEGWKVDSLGNTVGVTTNRPVLFLEDFIVALRANNVRGGPVISCSIDPTEEGLRRLRQVSREFTAQTGPALASRRIEQALGRQQITVTGVPASSHYARVLVAADFRMKRLAMNFQPAPVDGMPSYLHLFRARGAGVQNMLPRWWLATHYDPVLQDAEGLAWEIRGQGVKCMTEDELVSSSGERQRTGQASSAAKKWADTLTERFDELANEDSAFGHLRNVMDASVAAALLVKEGLLEHVGLELPAMTADYELEQYNTPQTVASQASFIKKNGRWIISASGGVQMTPWQVAERIEKSDALAPVREQATAGLGDAWWWQ